MRLLGIVFILLASTLFVSAEDWTTADGKVYKNVVVVAQEDDGVRITYDGGVGKIPYYELPVDLQKRFGQDYDSLEAKRKAAEKALADATRNADAAAAAALKKQQEDAAAAAAAQAQNGGTAQPGGSQPGGQQPNAPGQSIPQPAVNRQPAPPPAPPPAPAPENENENPSSPTIAAAQASAKALYPASRFSYDEGLDVCHLDSSTVNVMLVVPEATPIAAAPVGTLMLRITTDGHTPERPDQIQATFVPSGTVKKAGDSHSIKFLVDGRYVPVTDVVSDDPAQVGDTVSFYLPPEQARQIFSAKNVNFSVGTVNYMIDQNGMAALRNYFDDLDHLPPASTNFVKAYHKFLNRLPSIITVISTVCEYIILGSFAIVVAASIAAFIMGVTRFIKM